MGETLQANWKLGGFSPLLLESLVGNNFTCCAPKCASSGSLKTRVNKNLMQDYSSWIRKITSWQNTLRGPPKNEFIDDDLRLKARSSWQNTLLGPPKKVFIDDDLRLKAYYKKTWGPSSTFAFKEVNHLWDVIDPDGLDLLRVQICFLWVSEDVRQQNPHAGLLVLHKQKYEADKILSWALPIRNLSTTISNLKHPQRDVRPELNVCFQGSKPLMGCN